MAMYHRFSLDDLIQIATAGGGFEIAGARFSALEIMRVATAASKSGARITIRNTPRFSLDELLRIPTTGQGAVLFAED